jgi:hypothetical protein
MAIAGDTSIVTLSDVRDETTWRQEEETAVLE